MVTCSFKRRTASKQAASRKVEGIEPRKCKEGRATMLDYRKPKLTVANWQVTVNFFGV